ncbi:MAG: uroporphyrinogen-III C-methyltransferase [Micrococcaceae bacterium]|nr:uroporphyrinogen-III C-methyltransferase [Micrococcaceae bacterium]MDN5825055.1 uroporphyrinogen-III C-methyltransferase [Micrococcaceae bacterium]MDN5880467.1 uroporphyrinogen-III C-methyltransferase [Micrococcaceae bacterium]MDN5887848.1 uroporphyrinogen-III C-methyltransferase [Micrococcaceae bacterium]
MNDLYPTSLRLLGRRVLLVGAGPVSERRLKALLDAGARVTVVAPDAVEGIRRLHAAGLLDWHPRPYRATDLKDTWFVHTATGDPAVDSAVASDAEKARLWCVNASNHRTSTVFTPAVARIDEVVVAVNTDGDPRRAGRIRTAIRVAAQTGLLPWRRFRPRAPQEQGTTPAGRVALVGGGPGESGLITVRGRQLLAEADVVVADRLGPRALLEELGPDVRVIEVGKAPGAHTATQDQINDLLVGQARAGNLVVRLKGGDPFVFGRGGEEAEHCRGHGLAVEVVPGVTSALSVPAAAGIPVTHRGVAAGFTVATGHDELADLPARSDHTLVLLMGVRRLAESVATLGRRGLGPDTPVAIIESGWTVDQRVTIGTLATITDQAAARRVANPAVIVIGDVVNLSTYTPDTVAVPAPAASLAV